MRKLAALALLFSAQAFACPNLTGEFTCTYQDGSTEKVSITQADKNGVTVYNYNGADIPTDNQPYPMQDTEEIKSATLRSWCEADVLKANMLGKYYNGGSYFGNLDMTLNFTIENGSLKNETTGNLNGNDGKVYPLNGTVLCTRN